jgi:DNA invertase Pin-like site-specific DNA recombinase
LARLGKDVRRWRVDLVMVWKLEAGSHQGVGFACLTQDLDTSWPTGRSLLTYLAVATEFERGLIAGRVREGMANARRM